MLVEYVAMLVDDDSAVWRCMVIDDDDISR